MREYQEPMPTALEILEIIRDINPTIRISQLHKFVPICVEIAQTQHISIYQAAIQTRYLDIDSVTRQLEYDDDLEPKQKSIKSILAKQKAVI